MAVAERRQVDCLAVAVRADTAAVLAPGVHHHGAATVPIHRPAMATVVTVAVVETAVGAATVVVVQDCLDVLDHDGTYSTIAHQVLMDLGVQVFMVTPADGEVAHPVGLCVALPRVRSVVRFQ